VKVARLEKRKRRLREQERDQGRIYWRGARTGEGGRTLKHEAQIENGKNGGEGGQQQDGREKEEDSYSNVHCGMEMEHGEELPIREEGGSNRKRVHRSEVASNSKRVGSVEELGGK